MQLIFQLDTDPPQRTAVAVFFKKAKKKSEFLARLISSVMGAAVGNVTQPGAPGEGLNLGEAVPRNAFYFSYEGSGTTPPCEENVKWMLLQSARLCTADQIEKIAKVLDGGKNARVTQPLN